MRTFKDVIELLRGESGRVFIVDETGELRLVVMQAQEYAQLKQAAGSGGAGHEPQNVSAPSREQVPVQPPFRDLREEVIDPSFNFDDGEDL